MFDLPAASMASKDDSWHVCIITKASLLGGPLGEASAGVVVYANEVSRGGHRLKRLILAAQHGD